MGDCLSVPARILLVVLLGMLTCQAAPAQSIPGLKTDDDAPQFDGRSFGGVDLPAQPQRADVLFASVRTFAWSEGSTRRLLMQNQVQVRIGTYEFSADRALVWIEPVQLDGRPLEQIAVWFENVQDPGADSRIAQTAPQLLVTAIAEGEIVLRSDRFIARRPTDPFITEGEGRFARFLTQQAASDPVRKELIYRDQLAFERRPIIRSSGVGVVDNENLAAARPNVPIFPDTALVSFYGPDRTFVTGEEENALVITGGVVAQATDLGDGQSLQLSAENLVVFLDPGAITDIFSFGPGEIRGIYLEGDVSVTDGQYSLRGPRVFYDIQLNRGVVLDAVFSTFDAKHGLPLYLRASVIRQESANQWSAGNATITNTAFFDPLFAIGADTVTITQNVDADGETRTIIDAENVGLKVGEKPLVGIKRYRGEGKPGALRRVTVGSENGDPFIKTRFSLDSAFDEETNEWLTAELLADGYFDRGPAVGLDFEWEKNAAKGSLFSYYIHDEGEDRLTSGAKLDPPQRNRGLLLSEHQMALNESWSLSAEGTYISDENFIDSFFESMAETRREFANSLHLKWDGDSGLFRFETRGTFNDFLPNEYLVQSQGYQVERLPEAHFWANSTKLFGSDLNLLSDIRLGAMSLQFSEPTSAELGFNTQRRSQAAFGLDPNQSLRDSLEAQGYTDDTVVRLDSRQELSMALDWAGFRFRPYLVGRGTVYDNEFGSFREANGSDEDDKSRLWGAAGIDLSTSFVRINNNARNEFLNVDRLRHIVTPTFSAWASASNLDKDDLPIYDDGVEGISDGATIRVALNNTWQTKRRGPNGPESVDWIVLDTAYVHSSNDADRDSPIGRYFTSRPEESNLGEYVTNDAVWRLTNAVSISSSASYDVEDNDLSQIAGGVLIDHGYGFSSFTEARNIDALDSTFLNAGASYELSRKYSLEGAMAYDVDESDLQRISGTLIRRMPQWTLELGVVYDDIRSDTSVSVQFRPVGVGGEDRPRIFTQEEDVLGNEPDDDSLFWRR